MGRNIWQRSILSTTAAAAYRAPARRVGRRTAILEIVTLKFLGFRGYKGVAVAVFGKRSDVRQEPMRSGDHCFVDDGPFEDSPSRLHGHRRVLIEVHLPIWVLREQRRQEADIRGYEQLPVAGAEQMGYLPGLWPCAGIARTFGRISDSPLVGLTFFQVANVARIRCASP